MKAYNRPEFQRFIDFGDVGDASERGRFVEFVAARLEGDERVYELGDGFVKYIPMVEEIAADDSLISLRAEHPRASNQIAQDVLSFVNKSTLDLSLALESEFDGDSLHMQDLEAMGAGRFLERWEEIKVFFQEHYESRIDVGFYSSRVDALRIDGAEEVQERTQLDNDVLALKMNLLETWKSRLSLRKAEAEEKLFAHAQDEFTARIFTRIAEYKQLIYLLEPFTRDLSKLWDLSRGYWHDTDFDVLNSYGQLLTDQESLEELARLLGRFRRAEVELEEERISAVVNRPDWKVEHAARSELVGVHESDDLNNLLPSETALLAQKDTQSIFLKKFADKKLQSFEYRGFFLDSREEPQEQLRVKVQEQGPFIICVDTSASMEGLPELMAKTICFGILKIALEDNRKCFLISFSTYLQTLELTDLGSSLEELVHFLSMSFHGGTDASPPLEEALHMLKEDDYHNADVLMISDFVMDSLDVDTQAKVEAAKLNRTKFHSLAVCEGGNADMVNEFDHNWIFDATDRNGMIKLVRKIQTFK